MKQIKFEGNLYSFPDDASDDEIRQALSSVNQPRTPQGHVEAYGNTAMRGIQSANNALMRGLETLGYTGSDTTEQQRAETLTTQRKLAEEGMQDHPVAGVLGSLAGYAPAMLASAMNPLAGAVLGGATAGEDRYQEVLDKTGDEDLAKVQGAVAGGMTGLGFRLAPAFGSSLPTRAASGAGINIGLNEAEIGIQNAMHDEESIKLKQFDPVNMAVSGGLGAAFGAISKPGKQQSKVKESSPDEVRPSEYKYQDDFDQATKGYQFDHAKREGVINRVEGSLRQIDENLKVTTSEEGLALLQQKKEQLLEFREKLLEEQKATERHISNLTGKPFVSQRDRVHSIEQINKELDILREKFKQFSDPENVPQALIDRFDELQIQLKKAEEDLNQNVFGDNSDIQRMPGRDDGQTPLDTGAEQTRLNSDRADHYQMHEPEVIRDIVSGKRTWIPLRKATFDKAEIGDIIHLGPKEGGVTARIVSIKIKENGQVTGKIELLSHSITDVHERGFNSPKKQLEYAKQTLAIQEWKVKELESGGQVGHNKFESPYDDMSLRELRQAVEKTNERIELLERKQQAIDDLVNKKITPDEFLERFYNGQTFEQTRKIDPDTGQVDVIKNEIDFVRNDWMTPGVQFRGLFNEKVQSIVEDMLAEAGFFSRDARGFLTSETKANSLNANKERIVISDGSEFGSNDVFRAVVGRSSGIVKSFGRDRTVIIINKAEMTNLMKQLNLDPAKLLNKNSTEEHIRNFEIAVTIAHEIGHRQFNKIVKEGIYNTMDLHRLVKNDFQQWYKEKFGSDKQSLIDAFVTKPSQGVHDPDNTIKFFSHFGEFYAQQFTKDVINRVVSNDTQIRSKLTGQQSTFFNVDRVKDWLSNVIKYIGNRFGVKLKPEDFMKNFFDSFSQKNADILNKEGMSLFDYYQLKNKVIDKDVNFSRELLMKELNAYDASIGRVDTSYWKDSKIQRMDLIPAKNIPNTIQRVLDQLTEDLPKMRSLFASNLMPMLQKAQLWKDNPAVTYMKDVLRMAQHTKTELTNKWLKGDVSWNEFKNVVDDRKTSNTQLPRIVKGDSPEALIRLATEQDGAAVKEVFERYYGQNAQPDVSHLTPFQQKLFSSLRNLFDTMHKDISDIQNKMGKNNILPNVDNWYSAARQGDFYFVVEYKGTPIRSEFYRYEKQARDIANKIRSQYQGNSDITIVTGQKEVSEASNFSKAIVDETYQELLRKNPSLAPIVTEIQSVLTNYGGKLGKHHDNRINLPGYEGSKVFKTQAENGKAWLKGVQSSAQEYANIISHMIVGHHTDELVNHQFFKDGNFEGTHIALQTMQDLYLNKTPSAIEGVDEAVRKGFDGLIRKAFEAVGKEYYPNISTFDRTSGILGNLFYMFNLITRPVFSFANLMTTPLAIRQMLREGNVLDSITAASKGLVQLMKPDEDFLKFVKWASQDTDTFHPQFINELTESPFIKPGSKTGTFLEYVLLQRASTWADSMSRYWASTAFYEQFKAQGYSGKELWEKTAEAVDTSIVRYGRTDRAPIFQRAGVVGELASPLMTFPTASYGNLVADLKLAMQGLSKAELNKIAPLIATYAMTGMLAGVYGMPGIGEYEALRIMLRDVTGGGIMIPSVTEQLLKTNNDALTFGLLSAATKEIPGLEQGLDVGSGLRYNPIVQGIISNGSSDALSIFPSIKFASDFIGNTATAVKGNAQPYGLGMDVPQEELRKANLATVPGYFKGIVDVASENALNRDFVPGGTRGHAIVPQNREELVGSFIGAKSLNERKSRMELDVFKNTEDFRRQQVTRAVTILTDSLLDGNSDKTQRQLEKLIELESNPKNISNLIISDLRDRNVPEAVRRIMGSRMDKLLSSYEKQRKFSNNQEFSEQALIERFQKRQ